MLKVFRSVWPINIRTQMMLWYTLIFAILIFLFGTVFYINLQTSLETNIDAELQQHGRRCTSGARRSRPARPLRARIRTKACA